MGIDRARLPARHELKYYINPAELEALGRRLARVMRMDSHCKGATSASEKCPFHSNHTHLPAKYKYLRENFTHSTPFAPQRF